MAAVVKDDLEFFQVIEIIQNSTIFPILIEKLDWILLLSTFPGSSSSEAAAPGQKAATYIGQPNRPGFTLA